MKNQNKEQKQKEKKNNIIKTNDFIEFDYVGRTLEGDVFDTNIPEQLKKINPNINKENLKNQPKIFCIGQKMLLENLEKNLINKKIPGKYKIELKPEQAFGFRKPELIKTFPIKLFMQQNTPPRPGMVFALDNKIVKILSVSGGRVVADFNNPLANKDVIYEVNIKRKITDLKEKTNSLILYFFKKQIDFDLDKQNKRIILKEKSPFINSLKPKFKEILGLDLVSKENNETKQQKDRK